MFSTPFECVCVCVLLSFFLHMSWTQILQAENKVLWGAFSSIASEIYIVQNDNSAAFLETLQMCTCYLNIVIAIINLCGPTLNNYS